VTVGTARAHGAVQRRDREAAILFEGRAPAHEQVVQVRAGAAAGCLRPASKAGLVPIA
jgi:hypothetical protein